MDPAEPANARKQAVPRPETHRQVDCHAVFRQNGWLEVIIPDTLIRDAHSGRFHNRPHRLHACFSLLLRHENFDGLPGQYLQEPHGGRYSQ